MNVDLDACVTGDERAWANFVRASGPIIWSAVARTTGSGIEHQDNRNDIVQDVFVRLVKDDFRLLRTFDSERASLVTWLSLVARSTAIDWLRKRRVETVELAVEPISKPRDRHGREVPLHILTARQRLVLAMLFDEDMPIRQVASMLGVDDQTIRSTKHKALERLRKHFQPGSETSPDHGDKTARSAVQHFGDERDE